MFSVKRESAYPYGASRMAAVGVVVCLGIVAAACSADFKRLDAQSRGLGLSDTGSVPTPPQPIGRSPGSEDAMPPSPSREPAPPRRWSDDQRGSRGSGSSGIASSGLPEPSPAAGQPYGQPVPGRMARAEPMAPPRAELQPAAQPYPAGTPRAGAAASAAAPSIASGGEIEVVKGDTLFAISRRHGVSISELMTINGLKTPDIKPGQRLVLPGSERAGRTVATPAPAAKTPVKRVATKPVVPSAQPEAAPRGTAIAPVTPSSQPVRPAATTADAGWTGTHEVKPGDSLYAIARKHHVKLDELQRANNISDPRKVKPGVVLKVPGGVPTAGGAVTVLKPEPAEARKAPERALEKSDDASSPRPTIINRGNDGSREPAAAGEKTSDVRPLDGTRRVAALSPTSTRTDAPVASKGPDSVHVVPAAKAIGKLRWPVKGKVVVNFGPRPDGSHNDGINLSVPAGTEVHAAEAGEVVYAGNELKSYGNLVLIRHNNGWVTAYGHNDAVLVTRGDKVKRGQPIAKVGKSGSVDQPQLHFEIREDSKPIDPLPHLEKG